MHLQSHTTITDFLDIRHHGFRRVGQASPVVYLGDPKRNAAEHVRWLEAALEEGVEYFLFPELSLTGYSCGVLFRQAALRKSAITALERLRAWSAEHRSIAFTVGLPLVVEGKLLNVVVTISGGVLLAIVPKTYPPEGNEFDELRWFARATQVSATSVKLCGQTVPFGTDIILAHEEDDAFAIAHGICEDDWVPIPPTTLAALHGATILTNSSASNYVIGKDEYREMLVKARSGPTQAVYMYQSAGYGETSSGMTWDNDGFIAERGAILARAKRFAKNGQMIVMDVDVATLVQERMNQTSFQQNAADHPATFRRVAFRLDEPLPAARKTLLEFRRTINPFPFVPSDPATLNKRCEDIMNGLAMALARRIESLPEKMRRIYLGYSGGRDSTLTLLLAIRAMDICGLPRTNIVCRSLPGPGTSKDTKDVATNLPMALGVTFGEFPIMSVVSETAKATGFDLSEWEKSDVTRRKFENFQALVRKHLLFCDANQDGIVLATGDYSEGAVGWCTFGADQFGYFSLNANVGKTLVEHNIRWSATHVLTASSDERARQLLLRALELEISPELLPPGSDGKIAQKSEEAIGPFELLDFFGNEFVRFSRSPETNARLAWAAFNERMNPLTGVQYAIGDIKHWLTVFIIRFFAAQAKRTASPEGVKIATTSLDPRGDWRMPSDIKPDTWLEAVENIPDSLAIVT